MFGLKNVDFYVYAYGSSMSSSIISFDNAKNLRFLLRRILLA